MTTAGEDGIPVGSDNWSVYSSDGSLACHFEHTVAVTAEGPRILTPWHLEEARRAAEPLLSLTVRPAAVSWAAGADSPYESTSFSQTHVREVQGHPPKRR